MKIRIVFLVALQKTIQALGAKQADLNGCIDLFSVQWDFVIMLGCYIVA